MIVDPSPRSTSMPPCNPGDLLVGSSRTIPVSLAVGVQGRFTVQIRYAGPTQLLVNVADKPASHEALKALIIHEAGENVLVLLHSINEQGLQYPIENQSEFVLRIGLRGLLERFILHRCLGDLIEE